MHPDFCHSRKRYPLSFIVGLLKKRFAKGRSRYWVSRRYGVHKSNLYRWERGFSSHESAKNICCDLHAHSPPVVSFGRMFMSYLSRNGFLHTAGEAAMVMVRLAHDFKTALY